MCLQMWDPKKYTKEINEGVEFILNSYGKYEEPEKHFNKYGWYYHTQACFPEKVAPLGVAGINSSKMV